MTKITTLNRDQAIHLIKTEDLSDAALISISNDGSDWLEMQTYCGQNHTLSKVAFVECFDIESAESRFDKDKALWVLEHLDKWISGKSRPTDIYIHCDLGASRSRSVAIFANHWYGLDQEDLGGVCNRYIYDVLTDTALQSFLDSKYTKP